MISEWILKMMNERSLWESYNEKTKQVGETLNKAPRTAELSNRGYGMR